MSDDEIDSLTRKLGGMSLQEKVNDLGLDTNCYYCCVAGALETNVTELVRVTEIMQTLGGEDLGGIGELIKAAGLGGGSYDEYTLENLHTAPTPSILCIWYGSQGHAIRLTGTGSNGFSYKDHQNATGGEITPQDRGPLNGGQKFFVFPTSK